MLSQIMILADTTKSEHYLVQPSSGWTSCVINFSHFLVGHWFPIILSLSLIHFFSNHAICCLLGNPILCICPFVSIHGDCYLDRLSKLHPLMDNHSSSRLSLRTLRGTYLVSESLQLDRVSYCWIGARLSRLFMQYSWIIVASVLHCTEFHVFIDNHSSLRQSLKTLRGTHLVRESLQLDRVLILLDWSQIV